jgi:hypothetical protein
MGNQLKAGLVLEWLDLGEQRCKAYGSSEKI